MSEYRASMMMNNYDNKENQPNNDLNDDTNKYVNTAVAAVTLGPYTEANINPESEHFKFAYYGNGHAIIYHL
jgi:hypothetical protein